MCSSSLCKAQYHSNVKSYTDLGQLNCRVFRPQVHLILITKKTGTSDEQTSGFNHEYQWNLNGGKFSRHFLDWIEWNQTVACKLHGNSACRIYLLVISYIHNCIFECLVAMYVYHVQAVMPNKWWPHIPTLSIKNHWMEKAIQWSRCYKRNSLSKEGIFTEWFSIG